MFGRNRPDRNDRPKFGSYMSGRGGRSEYWITTAIAVALGVLFSKHGTAAGASGLMLVITVRRLHDFGQTGWWAALPLAAGVAIGVVMVTSPALGTLLAALALLSSVVFTAFIGLMPGDQAPNRFGEPPRPLFRRKGANLNETFG